MNDSITFVPLCITQDKKGQNKIVLNSFGKTGVGNIIVNFPRFCTELLTVLLHSDNSVKSWGYIVTVVFYCY